MFMSFLFRLGVPPEGCSSVHFARIMGEANAERMLGKEGWKPIAHEAKEVGLVKEVVPHDRLLDRLVHQRKSEMFIHYSQVPGSRRRMGEGRKNSRNSRRGLRGGVQGGQQEGES